MKIKRSSKCTTKFMTAAKKVVLQEVMTEYSRVVNLFIAMFWEQDLRLRDLTKEITNLPESWLSARMRQCAAREALGMVDGARTKAERKGEEPVIPVHSGKTMTLSSQIVSIQKGRNSFDLWVVISCVGNGIKLSVPIKRHRHFNFFSDWKMASTIIIHKNYIQFSFETETEEKKTEGECLGIDVGINHLIALSNGVLSGSNVRQMIKRIKNKQQGSNKQKKAKKELSYYLHKQVKEIFQQNNLRLVVVEKLKNLKQGKSANRGKEFRKTLNNWNYRELLNIIQMRSEENRVSFRSVNPYKTSQTCPACSHVERGNRSNEVFRCLRCGYSDHADVVGAANILTRFTSGRYGAAFQT